MLKRKITEQLRQWRHGKGQECLFLKGARQVGKSFAVAQFGKADYRRYIEIDFIKHPAYRDIFDGDLDAQSVYERMSLIIPGFRLEEGSTLVFLDEIQECPRARTALKYLAQDGRADVVASGSLLGIAYREETADTGYSVSVGYERHMEMRALDFEEFCWAVGYERDALGLLRGYLAREEAVPRAVNERMHALLREYLAIGGMPSVVQRWADARNWADVHAEQKSISAAYLDDIAKYAPADEKAKARACYLSLPQQLAKENTKFRYAVVQKGGSARKYRSSLDWLRDASVVDFCSRVSAPQFPLAAYESSDEFRVYLNDTGLLMALYPHQMKRAVVDNTLSGPMKGGLYENLVACMLRAHGVELRYWMSKDSNYEVEFLIDGDTCVVPVEVKAGRGQTASLNRLLAREDIALGYKLTGGNVGRDGKKVTLPLYMAAFLFDE